MSYKIGILEPKDFPNLYSIPLLRLTLFLNSTVKTSMISYPIRTSCLFG